MDLQRLACRLAAFEVGPAEMPQTDIHRFPLDGFAHHVGMPLKLVADGGADEVGPVRVETVLHQQIDMTEINIAEIDRDLLAIRPFGPKLVNVLGHASISLPSMWMVYGGLALGSRGLFARVTSRGGPAACT